MKNAYFTERLTLPTLQLSDAEFILELVNTKEWKQFIGDRNVHTIEDSENYIAKILSSANVSYWTVRLKDCLTGIGVITFIKRDYLPHHDIGFAFLPQYGKKGYAIEAAKLMLDDFLVNPLHPVILASTLAENDNSIQLLLKLGFKFERELVQADDKLQIYSTAKPNQ